MVKNLNSTPLVSVLMPVYNCESYIRESVKSILDQSFTDFELIIIDDCSNDKTVEIIKSIDDKRIHLVTKPCNTGYTESLNYGLSIIKGKYVARMDGDDISTIDRFKLQYEFLESNSDVVLCGTGYDVINSEMSFNPLISHSENLLQLIDNCPFAHPSIMMRAEVLKKFNIQYDSSYEPAEDYKLWTEVSKFGKVANLSNKLLKYRIHENQTTNKRAIQQISLSQKISTEHLNRLTNFHQHSNYYVNGVLNSIEDFKKYKLIEFEIKNYFEKNNVKYLNKIFEIRAKRYFINSLVSRNFTPLAFLNLIPLLFRIYKIIGLLFIIKLFIKSLIFWKGLQMKKIA